MRNSSCGILVSESQLRNPTKQLRNPSCGILRSCGTRLYPKSKNLPKYSPTLEPTLALNACDTCTSCTKATQCSCNMGTTALAKCMAKQPKRTNSDCVAPQTLGQAQGSIFTHQSLWVITGPSNYASTSSSRIYAERLERCRTQKTIDKECSILG